MGKGGGVRPFIPQTVAAAHHRAEQRCNRIIVTCQMKAPRLRHAQQRSSDLYFAWAACWCAHLVPFQPQPEAPMCAG